MIIKPDFVQTDIHKMIPAQSADSPFLFLFFSVIFFSEHANSMKF